MPASVVLFTDGVICHECVVWCVMGCNMEVSIGRCVMRCNMEVCDEV